MADRNRPLMIVVVIFIVAFFVIRFFLVQDQLEHDWSQTQSLRSEEPYGQSLLLELLEEASGGDLYEATGPLVDTLPLVEDTLNYLYLDREFYYDSAEIAHLMEFVQIGNKAFFVFDYIPWWMNNALGLDYSAIDDYYYDSTLQVEINFADSQLIRDSAYLYSALHADTPIVAYWNYFDYNTFYDSMMVYDFAKPIGTIEGGVNFASFQYGKGTIFIHVEGRLFSNVYLAQKDGFEYASKAMSVLDNKPIFIDHYNSHFHYSDENAQPPSVSPLKFIFAQPTLRYAWYALLVGVLLFVLFRSKRQQRIIPIIPSPDNTSIEFAKALGTLYYQSNSPKYLTGEMMRLFHTFNRRRYNVQPGKKGVSNADEVSRKSKIGEPDIKHIYDLERRLRYNDLARMNEVIPLYEALNNYYKNAR